MQKTTTLAAIVLTFAATIARADVNQALNALHEAGTNLKSLAADISLKNTSGDLGDEDTKRGTFVLQKLPDGDSRIRVSFNERQVGSKIYADRRDYLLAGADLIDRDYVNKKQTTRQVREPGQKLDLFKLGEGPFPLPIGQPSDQVLKDFDVKEIENKDPAILAALVLSPKPGSALADKFKSITVKIDKTTKMPAEIKTVDAQDIDRNTATLTKIRVNDAIDDKAFALEPINEKEWNLVSGK